MLPTVPYKTLSLTLSLYFSLTLSAAQHSLLSLSPENKQTLLSLPFSDEMAAPAGMDMSLDELINKSTARRKNNASHGPNRHLTVRNPVRMMPYSVSQPQVTSKLVHSSE
jgi:hypothetical protein